MSNKLVDPFGRAINYLRLSVTDKCNLNCFYCRSDPNRCTVEPSEEELTVDHYRQISEVAVALGITRIRLTGGEPLLRTDIVDIVKSIAGTTGIGDVSLTTNGMLLEKMAEELAAARLKRVNISLDSLDEANFRQITKGGRLKSTLKGIERSLQAGLVPVKLNVVLLKGINDHEIEKFIRLTLDRDLHVRFIEYMPTTGQQGKWSQYFLDLARVMEIGASVAPLQAVEGEHGGGPARYYTLQGAVGKIGLISPLSRHFCACCNRLRVTADGKLKPCLFSEDEVDLRPALGDGEKLQEKFREAMALRTDPRIAACTPGERSGQFRGKRFMSQIGG
ncbi:MAG: GTP 3',8-cyclase MoaA [Bacillota bacterium]